MATKPLEAANHPEPRAWPGLKLALIVAAITLTAFGVEAHRNFGLSDEGFLWYGVQRLLAGEVPGRDFMAYDVGRYFWSGALMALAGNHGLVALRACALLFEAVCLFVGLLTLARHAAPQRALFWLVAASATAVWMSPLYRIFDIALPLLPIAALAALIEKPTSARAFWAGAVTGLVAVFGRNHGLYAAAASLGVLGYLSLAPRAGPGLLKTLGAWAAGVGVGYLPILLLFAFVPGFETAFLNELRLIFEIKATNVGIRVPFPWRLDLQGLSSFWVLEKVLMGCCFIGIVAFGAMGSAWACWRRLKANPSSPAFVAAAFVALPYAHMAYSRADLLHLASSLVPVVLGLYAWLSTCKGRVKWAGALGTWSLSLLAAAPLHAYWPLHSAPWVTVTVGSDRLVVDPPTAALVDMFDKLVPTFAPGRQSFVAIASLPGVYAMFERRSPIWETYAAFPRGAAFQRSEIERLEVAKPVVVVELDYAIDGRPDLRYPRTHPLIEQYFRTHYEPVRDYPVLYPFQLYRRRGSPGPQAGSTPGAAQGGLTPPAS